jgi:hypothetical protein
VELQGLELYPRQFNRSTSISANYHALVNSAVLRSLTTAQAVQTTVARRQLAVLSRHTMGVATLAAGSLEYMMMRRLTGTDNQGPWPLNETTPLVIKTAILAGAASTVEPLRLHRALEFENPPLIMYSTTVNTIEVPVTQTTQVVEALPAGLHLLSLYVRMPSAARNDSNVQLVVQLQNTVEHGEPLTLKSGINSLLGAVSSRLLTCTETTLTLQQPLAENRRLVWRAHDGSLGGYSPDVQGDGDCLSSDLIVNALDIRSFVLDLK